MATIEPTKYRWEALPDGRRRKVPLPGTTWKVRYRKPNGRAGAHTSPTKIEARRWLEANGADMHRGDWIDPSLRRSRFDEWAEAYERGLGRLAPNTTRVYRLILSRHVRPHFDGRPIAGIDYQDVEDFIGELFDKGLGPKSTRECVSVLAQVMKVALRARAIKDNPAAGHHIRVPKQRGQVLPLDKLLRLVDEVQAEYRTAVLLLIYTGLRPAEMCGLRVRSFDPQRRLLTVNETLSPIGRELVAGPTKSDQERVLPLPGFIAEEVVAYLDARRAQGGPTNPEDHLFLNPSARPINRDSFRKHVLRPALVRAGLPEDFRTYDMRHSHASQLIDLGANPLAVKERLGHTDILTTFRRYGHLFEGVQQQLADDLDIAHRDAVERRGRDREPSTRRESPGLEW